MCPAVRVRQHALRSAQVRQKPLPTYHLVATPPRITTRATHKDAVTVVVQRSKELDELGPELGRHLIGSLRRAGARGLPEGSRAHHPRTIVVSKRHMSAELTIRALKEEELPEWGRLCGAAFAHRPGA